MIVGMIMMMMLCVVVVVVFVAALVLRACCGLGVPRLDCSVPGTACVRRNCIAVNACCLMRGIFENDSAPDLCLCMRASGLGRHRCFLCWSVACGREMRPGPAAAAHGNTLGTHWKHSFAGRGNFVCDM